MCEHRPFIQDLRYLRSGLASQVSSVGALQLITVIFILFLFIFISSLLLLILLPVFIVHSQRFWRFGVIWIEKQKRFLLFSSGVVGGGGGGGGERRGGYLTWKCSNSKLPMTVPSIAFQLESISSTLLNDFENKELPHMTP